MRRRCRPSRIMRQMPSCDTPLGAPSLQSGHYHSTGTRRGTIVQVATCFLNALQPPPLRGAMGTPGMTPLPYTLVTFSTEPLGRWYIWSISFTLKACKSRKDYETHSGLTRIDAKLMIQSQTSYEFSTNLLSHSFPGACCCKLAIG